MVRLREMTRIGRYDLLAPIGEGGMARVFLARQKGPAGFEKIVVIKLIHPHLAVQKQFVNMFLDEARIAAMINHGRVVQVYDLGVEDDIYYMVLEYLAGETFTTVLEAKTIEPQVGARIVAHVAEGLHAAHELRDVSGKHLEVVHRDVSPGNVIVKYDGGVKVLDFGVAKARGRPADSTGGRMKGKFSYMAPEQIASEPVDRRADIFSLGIMLWETLTGRRLFRRKNEAATVNAIMTKRPPPPSRYGSGVTTALDRVALRALSFQPEKRYQTAQEMRLALLACLPPDEDEISIFMRTTFEHRMNEREAMMRRLLEDVDEVDDDFIATISDSFNVEQDKSLSLPAAPTGGDEAAETHKWGSPVAVEYDDGLELEDDPDRRVPAYVDPESGEYAQIHSGEYSTVHSGEFDLEAPESAESARLAPREVSSYDSDGYSKPDAERIRRARAMAGLETIVDPGAAALRTPFRWGLVAVAAGSVFAALIAAVLAISYDNQPAEPFTGAIEIPIAGYEPAAATDDDRKANPEAAGDDVAVDAQTAAPDSQEDDAGDELDTIASQRKGSVRRPTKRSTRKGRSGPAKALYDAGIRGLIGGKLGEAEAKFKEAIAADSRYAPAYRGLGLVNERLGKRAAAVKWFRKYLKTDPDAPDSESIRKRIANLGG